MESNGRAGASKIRRLLEGGREGRCSARLVFAGPSGLRLYVVATCCEREGARESSARRSPPECEGAGRKSKACFTTGCNESDRHPTEVWYEVVPTYFLFVLLHHDFF